MKKRAFAGIVVIFATLVTSVLGVIPASSVDSVHHSFISDAFAGSENGVEKPPADDIDSESGRSDSFRTTSIVVDDDNRIGALYFSPLVSGDTSQRVCTANYLGAYYWLTAAHCVSNNMDRVGFIQQSDGEAAGIELIEMAADSTHDLALIRVGSGIKASPFELATDQFRVGQGVRVVGFSGQNDPAKTNANKNNFSSSTDFVVEDLAVMVKATDSSMGVVTTYRNQTRLQSTDDTGLCNGDSGAAVFTGNELYGVASTVAGKYHPTQENPDGKWFECGGGGSAANINEDIDWIKETMKKQAVSSNQSVRASKGKKSSASDPKDLEVNEVEALPASLSSSGSSSSGSSW